MTKSPNAADINEWTPIHAFGFLDIVELLVPLVTDGVLRFYFLFSIFAKSVNWEENREFAS